MAQVRGNENRLQVGRRWVTGEHKDKLEVQEERRLEMNRLQVEAGRGQVT